MSSIGDDTSQKDTPPIVGVAINISKKNINKKLEK